MLKSITIFLKNIFYFIRLIIKLLLKHTNEIQNLFPKFYTKLTEMNTETTYVKILKKINFIYLIEKYNLQK